MDATAGIIVGVFAIFFGVILLGLVALMLVAMWNIFVKMGEPGWKSIVPYYSMWTLIERLRKPRSWFWIIAISALIYMVLYSIYMFRTATLNGAPGGFDPDAMLLLLAMIPVWGVLMVYNIMLYHAMSESFGHGAGFTVGLLFLPVIFLCILAFGSDRFQLKEDRLAELYGRGEDKEPE